MTVLCSAVDNVLLKLESKGVDFLRLGRASTVEPSLHSHMPGGSRYPDTSVRGLAAAAANARVVRTALFIREQKYNEGHLD